MKLSSAAILFTSVGISYVGALLDYTSKPVIIDRPAVHLDVLWRGSKGQVMARDENFTVRLTKIHTLELNTFLPADPITKYLASRGRSPTVVTAVSGQRIFSARWMRSAKLIAGPEDAKNTVCMIVRRNDVSSLALTHKPFGNEYVFPFERGQSVTEVERAVGIECTAYYVHGDFGAEFRDWLEVDDLEYLRKYQS